MENDMISQTTLDRLVSDDQAQMLKAAIPYLPPSGQRIVSVYTKIQELSNTLALFAPSRQDVSICAQSEPGMQPFDVIQDIRRFCYGNSRQKLDQMSNMMAMLQILQLMNEGKEERRDNNE